MPKATKVSSVVTYGEGHNYNMIMKSHDYLSKWLCEVTWQIKNIKSDLSQYLSKWWLTARSSHP